MTIAARSAMHSIADAEPYACHKRASSDTNDFPAFPDGTAKTFLRQCTASAYAFSILVQNVFPPILPQLKFAGDVISWYAGSSPWAPSSFAENATSSGSGVHAVAKDAFGLMLRNGVDASVGRQPRGELELACELTGGGHEDTLRCPLGWGYESFESLGAIMSDLELRCGQPDFTPESSLAGREARAQIVFAPDCSPAALLKGTGAETLLFEKDKEDDEEDEEDTIELPRTSTWRASAVAPKPTVNFVDDLVTLPSNFLLKFLKPGRFRQRP